MFLTVEELKALTSFDELSGLSIAALDGYMERADSWIRRATNRWDLDHATDPIIQQDLKIATLLLTEYIWFWDTPEMKEQAISHDDTIRLGTYSFSKDKARPGEKTGNDELDSILESLKYNPKVGSIFQVSRKGSI